MINLEQRMVSEKPPRGQLLVYWLGGAGFVVKSRSVTIGIDLYLSNACMRPDGAFKRLTAPPAAAKNLKLDYLLASHEHGDHLDEGSIQDFITAENRTKLIAPGVTIAKAKSLLHTGGERFITLDRGGVVNFPEFALRAVTADHGPGTPDAVGFFLTAEKKTVYFLGDSCYREDFLDVIGPRPDIDLLLVPINGRFGNPNARDGAAFMKLLQPKLTVPCHFWLFAEHGGDPGEFIDICRAELPHMPYAIMAIGESILI